MTTIFNVAGFIVYKREETTAWQLQKLCYYTKAWSLALNNDSMFKEKFGAWKNGPVCRQLYREHRGRKNVNSNMFPYQEGSLSDKEIALIEAVLDKYGNMSGDELSELTHNEFPWQHARVGIPEGQNSNRNVDEKVIRDYYLINSDVYNEMEG